MFVPEVRLSLVGYINSIISIAYCMPAVKLWLISIIKEVIYILIF